MKCLVCNTDFTPKIDFLALFSPKKEKNSTMCPACWQKFHRLTGTRCPQCGREQEKSDICQDCQKWQRAYQGKILLNHAAYDYNAAFHDLMVSYKRYGDYILCQVLSELAKEDLVKLQFDYYVPVPTNPDHQQKRGYDTIWEIFSPLVPLTPLLLKKAGSGAQGEKNKKARMQAKQNFFLNPEFRGTITGKILLLDDIYTTGRTLYHARDMIWTAFPEVEIESFSISR